VQRKSAALRVIILSDTHGYLDPRIAELAATCDVAVHGGDVCGAAVLQALRPRTGRVIAVRGNNDVPAKWPPRERALLDSLPAEDALDLPGGRLVAVHGDRAGPLHARHDWLRRKYPEARLIVYGHSHRLVCDQSQWPWVVNPGAAGRARTFGGPSCVVLAAHVRAWRLEPHRFEPMARARRR